MGNPATLGTILEYLKKYGSLPDLRYQFIAPSYRARPYQSLIARLAETFKVKDVTEPEGDLSLSYVLEAPTGRWLLQLSLVGPFAVLTRTRGKTPPLTRESDLQPDELSILEGLERFNLTPLGQEILEHPLDPKVWQAEPGHTLIYDALFSHRPNVPWQS